MSDILIARAPKDAVKLWLVTEKNFASWLSSQPAGVARWTKLHDFKAKTGTFCVLPDEKGAPLGVVAGLSDPASIWDIADFSKRLPAGTYRVEGKFPDALALGWALGAYRFDRYKKSDKPLAKLVVGHDAVREHILEAITLARDLINTPAEDMGPEELANAIVKIGKTYGATVTQIIGNDLLKKNYPAIHAVGRASVRAPRLVDLTWGNPKHRRVTLVGKGVCFDTGGLDLKPSSAMYLMKKDMAGAASALAVAHMIMAAKLPVRLRLLIPAVENAVAGNAFRPSDIIKMRNGLTVEIGNTDAEGRLVLADALAEAVTDKPDMLIDFSTLTGAARTALGTELPALFCNEDKLADALIQAGRATEDPIWRLPLHEPYKKLRDSPVADLNSAPNTPYAGAITAALFLQRFVPSGAWIHLDMMAWNLSSKAGRPEGGEAMAVRAVFNLIAGQVRT